jgi:hypothetical protein
LVPSIRKMQGFLPEKDGAKVKPEFTSSATDAETADHSAWWALRVELAHWGVDAPTPP